MFIGYIQHNNDKTEQASQHQLLQSFAKEQGVELDCVYCDYDFALLKGTFIPACKGVIICNIRALGKNLSEIKENLRYCQEKKLDVWSIEDGYRFSQQNLTEDFFRGIDVAINVRSNLISQNVRNVLKQRKNDGHKLGRPSGTTIKKRLAGKENEICRLLSNNISKAEIARRLNVSRLTVYNFIKQNKLERKETSNA